jgi:hypothetical protein
MPSGRHKDHKGYIIVESDGPEGLRYFVEKNGKNMGPSNGFLSLRSAENWIKTVG